MRDPVTITLTFERPDTEEELAKTLNGMVQALPGAKGRRVRIRMEGVSDEFAAVFHAAHALTKARISARASRRKSQG